MADNEHQVPGPQPGPPPAAPPPAQPADPTEAPTPPRGELVIPPPTAPAPIDERQVREFQQFQQFQELMRREKERGFPQGEPPPPGFLQPWGPQPAKQNPVKRALNAIVGKIVTAVIVALLLIGAGYFAIDYFFGGPPSQPPASQIGGQKTKDRLLFEKNPRSAVRRVYENIAMGDQPGTCDRFTEDARAQFTAAFPALGDSCESVVDGLKAQVTEGMKDEYANPWIPAAAAAPTGDTATVSSCEFDVTGGPRLGRFTLGVIEGSLDGQWIVTGYEQENCQTDPSTPPTS
ncbi:hypothetical protein [Actinophytocola sediminis]